MENQEFAPAPQPVKYAGFWLRFVAILIDGIIISFVKWIIISPLLVVLGISAAHGSFDFEDECSPDFFANLAMIIGAFMVTLS